MAQTAKINVAIDGPAGAGKSTVARRVAAELKYIYIDTGAMYRAVALEAMRQHIPVTEDNRHQIAQLAERLNIELEPGGEGTIVRVNGEDVTGKIREPQVSRLVPIVAAIGEVRSVLVQHQRKLAAGKGVVMDGRDIGTHVIPAAEVKIFLTASVEERARRRYAELLRQGTDLTYEQVVQDMAERDRIDSEREIAPLVKAPDAILVDSTELTIDQVVSRIVSICRDVLELGEHDR